MLISPKQTNGVWVRHGNREAIGLLKEAMSSRRINTARGRRGCTITSSALGSYLVHHASTATASRHRHIASFRCAAEFGRSGTSEFPDEFFGREFGLRLGCVIIRRHEAGCRIAAGGNAGLLDRRYGRAPMSRPALVGHNRKLRYLGQIASKKQTSRPFGVTDKNVNRRLRGTGHCGR
jgi:hypothetical protein